MAGCIVLLRVDVLMVERGVRNCDLKHIASNDTITKWRRNTWKTISRKHIELLRDFFRCSVQELFVEVPCDLWFPAIAVDDDLTIHLGSRALPSATAPSSGPRALERKGVLEWDIWAYSEIERHLHRCGRGNIAMQVHSAGIESGVDPALQTQTAALLRHGIHIVIGSPIANPWSERVVALLYRARPYDPSHRGKFPYYFRYRERTVSSFGYKGVGGDYGIYSSNDALVARRDLIPETGEAEDCALIVVKRLPIRTRKRRFEGETRLCLVILGHGAAGTLGGTFVAIHPDYAAQLLPPDIETVRAGVVRVPFSRPEPGIRDNRHLLEPELIELTDVGPKSTRKLAVTPPTSPVLPVGGPSREGPLGRQQNPRMAPEYVTP